MSASFVLERLPAHGAAFTFMQVQRRRVYILPTRAGMLFALLLLVLLLGAMNYNNSLTYVLTFFLGGLFLICILHTHRNLAGLIIKGAAPPPVFAGGTAQFPVTLDNRHGQARIALELVCQERATWWGNKTRPPRTTTRIDVPAGCISQAQIILPAPRRGLLPLERVMISSTFPLGLFHAWSTLTLELACVVYPAPGGQMELPVPGAGQWQGEAGGQVGTHDFTGFRPYHPGDSIRTIAWKALAREQPLLVKRFSGEGGRDLILSWDDTAHLSGIEARLSQLCRWVLRAAPQQINYGLHLPGSGIDPGQGETHRARCLEALALFGHVHEQRGS